jgi:anaerobic nitric oxide reductase transcription regulator
LQQGEVQRVGSDRSHKVDVRVLAATNRDLEREIAANRFRADLYHRLATYPIVVPPLRARLEDLPILTDHLLSIHQRRIGCATPVLGADCLDLLRRYPWPGNVRELDNVLARAVLRAMSEQVGKLQLEIRPRHLSPDLQVRESSRIPSAPVAEIDLSRPFAEQVETFERRLILEAVEAQQGNWAAAARKLGMHRANLHAFAKRLGMK